MNKSAEIHEIHAQNCDETDFWGQIKRTVGGKPISQDQIDMIVAEMSSKLELESSDRLLDICCGNGALSHYFFDQCQGGLGVDYSPTLIERAKKYFDESPDTEYMALDALKAVDGRLDLSGFTKGLIYGSINYFSGEDVGLLLSMIHKNAPDLRRLVIGNVANLDKLHDFFTPDRYTPGVETDPNAPIGLWWSSTQFSDLAHASGWKASFSNMPDGFYAAHYRFDVTLERV